MKYIDADKLIAEIEKRRNNALERQKNLEKIGQETALNEMIAFELNKILSFIASLQQEQPEIGLEKFTEKVKTFQARYKHSESISIKGAMAFMARMFYQYPNVARQWYDSLPKATMDNARKE